MNYVFFLYILVDSGYHMGSFHDARAFSNAVMDDSYDLQAQSRGRDHRLLNQMNNALVRFLFVFSS